MRVITHLGLGTATPTARNDYMTVALDQPHLAQTAHAMPIREVFPLSDWGAIRILNVGGVGILSNLQFFKGPLNRKEYLDGLRVPPDETHFVFDLTDGSVRLSQELGLLAGDYMMMQPWLDRWGREPHPLLSEGVQFEDEKDARDAFESKMGNLTGSTGISANILFSTKDNRLLRLCLHVAPPQGRVCNWSVPQ